MYHAETFKLDWFAAFGSQELFHLSVAPLFSIFPGPGRLGSTPAGVLRHDPQLTLEACGGPWVSPVPGEIDMNSSCAEAKTAQLQQLPQLEDIGLVLT